MEDRLFEGTLAGIVIDGSSWLAQKVGERLPMTLHMRARAVFNSALLIAF
jgi:hypothetical protein